MTDDRAEGGRAKLALPEVVVAQGMNVFEEVLVREAALRILFPVEAENPSRSRAQRRWLVNFDLEEVIAGAERAIEKAPWRATWE